MKLNQVMSMLLIATKCIDRQEFNSGTLCFNAKFNIKVLKLNLDRQEHFREENSNTKLTE